MKNRYIYSNQHIAIGDIFYSSWGYDQTNIDFYKVKKLIGKTTVELALVDSKIVYDKSNEYQDAVVPYPASEGKSIMRKKIKYVIWDNYKEPRIKLNTYANAYPWDGKPKMQTNAYYGR